MAKQDEKEQASELFQDCVTGGSTPSIDCGFCGRTHFATGSMSCLEETERSELERKAKEHPDRYRNSPDDSIGFGYLDGKQAVYGCPCNAMARYERFILAHRDLILGFLAKTLDEERRCIEASANLLAEARPR